MSIDVALHPRLLRGHAPDLALLVDAVDASPRLLAQLEAGAEPVLGEESWDLVSAADAVHVRFVDAPVLLAGLANARPVAAQIARHAQAAPLSDLLIVCAGSGEQVASEDAYSAGVIVRLLLEELDQPAQMTDAAGMAVALTSSYPDARSALLASAGVRRRLSQGTDDAITDWSAQDVHGVVGQLRRQGALWGASVWEPAEAQSSSPV